MKTRQHQHYSEDEISRLKEALETGKSRSSLVVKMARVLDRTEAAIANKLYMLELETINPEKFNKYKYGKPVTEKVEQPELPLETVSVPEIIKTPEPVIKETHVPELPHPPVTLEHIKSTSICLASGVVFEFEGTAKKVILYNDHFRVYF